MKILISLFLGVAFGACSVLLHNAYTPWGLILSLIGSGLGIWLIGRGWGMRRYKAVASLGWFLTVMRAGVLGVGNELLVQGNRNGNVLLLVGVATLVFAISRKA